MMTASFSDLFLSRRPSLSKRGFSLIEAAIVLGVVGLVIGGIWVAAAAVAENWRVERTVSGISFIANSVQKSMTGYNASLIGDNHITDFVEKVGGIPKDWGQPNGGLDAISPLGKRVAVYNSTTYFKIWLHDIPRSPCIKILTKISLSVDSINVDPSLLFWRKSSTDRRIDPSQAASACRSLNYIEISYPYTQNR